MADWEKTIVPLADAHEVFESFRIGPYSKAYHRWRRDDGFRWVDLENVLNESPLVLTVDWREWLRDALEAIGSQLELLGIAVETDLDEEGSLGSVLVAGVREAVKYVPADEDDFDTVIQSLNRLIPGKARYRKFRSCEGSDGWSYGLLTDDDWKALEANAPNTVKLLFAPGF